MRCSFPNRDPWLEYGWLAIHARLNFYIADQSQRHHPAARFIAEAGWLADVLRKAGRW